MKKNEMGAMKKGLKHHKAPSRKGFKRRKKAWLVPAEAQEQASKAFAEAVTGY